MKFLRTEQVMEKVGLSRPTIWRMERAGEFPRRRKLGSNSVAWLEHEIDEWMESRQQIGVEDDAPGQPSSSLHQ